MKPDYRLEVNGNNITPQVSGRLISLSLTDERGDKADQLDIVLDDSDGQLAIPPRKAEIKVWLGITSEQNPSQGTGLVYKGAFIVDETSHSGAPDTLTIRARSSDFNSALKQKREQSWHDLVLGDILTTIAKRYNLEPIINNDLAAIAVEHIDQTNESDVSFLSRLGKHHSAIATIKAGRLLFAPAGAGKTASGTLIPTVTISRSDGDSHSYSDTGRDSDYSGVQANWNEEKHARLEKVLVGEEGNVKVVRHTYPNVDEARTAAKNEWNKLKRQGASFNLTLAIGNPRLYPETPVKASGWKTQIDNTAWVLARLVHNVNDSGYTNKLEMEVLGEEKTH